ncbi:MAG: methyltransferase domain-containing protein [Haloglomus sp.]
MTDEFDFDAEQAEFLATVYRTPSMVERRRRVRAALESREGDDVLCIGPGPGFEAARLADQVAPGGSVHATDVSQAMLSATRRRCEDRSNVTLCRGAADALPFGDDTVDAATSVQVYEYVEDTDAALGELSRVLRPGGRAVVVATDWRSFIWRTGDPARHDRIMAAYDDHCAHPTLGSRLSPLLADAGLDVVAVEPYSILCTRMDEDTFPLYFGTLVREYVRDHDDVSRSAVDDWWADLHEREADGETFFSLTQYIYTVETPS